MHEIESRYLDEMTAGYGPAMAMALAAGIVICEKLKKGQLDTAPPTKPIPELKPCPDCLSTYIYAHHRTQHGNASTSIKCCTCGYHLEGQGLGDSTHVWNSGQDGQRGPWAITDDQKNHGTISATTEIKENQTRRQAQERTDWGIHTTITAKAPRPIGAPPPSPDGDGPDHAQAEGTGKANDQAETIRQLRTELAAAASTDRDRLTAIAMGAAETSKAWADIRRLEADVARNTPDKRIERMAETVRELRHGGCNSNARNKANLAEIDRLEAATATQAEAIQQLKAVRQQHIATIRSLQAFAACHPLALACCPECGAERVSMIHNSHTHADGTQTDTTMRCRCCNHRLNGDGLAETIAAWNASGHGEQAQKPEQVPYVRLGPTEQPPAP